MYRHQAYGCGDLDSVQLPSVQWAFGEGKVFKKVKENMLLEHFVMPTPNIENVLQSHSTRLSH